MFRVLFFVLAAAGIMMQGCELLPENYDNKPEQQDTLSTVTFDFNIYKPRESCDDPVFTDAVYRYNLNIYPVDENNEPGELLFCASVQRLKRFYEFRLRPGKYKYEAAIICTGREVDCQNMGFPVGNLLWDVGRFEVVADSSITIVTDFR